MFVLGVLVGRGTAPVKFDIAALQNKMGTPQTDDSAQQKKRPAQKEAASVKDKTELDFYEALEENKFDTKVPELKKPKAVEPKTGKPAAKTDSQKPTPQKPKQKATSQKKKSKTGKVAAVEKTHAAGPRYTIQAASVKNAKVADQLVQKLKKSGYPAYRVIGKIAGRGIWFRVRIGEYKGKTEALNIMNKLKKDGYKPILVLR